ncbi:hypothetical protein ElyMa_003578500, partial [Elysia marginata]
SHAVFVLIFDLDLSRTADHRNDRRHAVRGEGRGRSGNTVKAKKKDPFGFFS